MNDLTFRKQIIETHFKEIMKALGLDMTDSSLKDTPGRVSKMLVQESCGGLFREPPIVTTFEFEDGASRDLIIIENIPFSSLCEHHFVPFIGMATVAYLPKDKYMGLSKAARVLDYFAERPQVQERLTSDVATFLFEALDPKGILVMISAEHMCMSTRGVKKHGSSTVTTAIRGEIDKQEVLSTIQLKR